MHLALAYSHVAIGNFGGLLEGISMLTQRANGIKIDTIIFVKLFFIFCVIKYHSGSPITLDNVMR